MNDDRGYENWLMYEAWKEFRRNELIEHKKNRKLLEAQQKRAEIDGTEETDDELED